MPSNSDSKPKYDFRTCLKKSEVLKPEVLEKWLSDHPDQSPNEDAARLVKQELLTEWQAKYLLSGRYRLHLGNYQLLTRVRKDSFGDRFVAMHPQLGRTVQVQVLPVELTEQTERREAFLSKASKAGELDHPNLAHVFDIDVHQGRYYLVTEHSPGMSLTELRRTTLDANQIANITRNSIAGLQHAHKQSVVHDYLSMDNVLVDENDVVKISQIALSPLAKKSSKMAKENVSPEQADLLAIVRMSRRLLNDLPSTGATRQLTTLLSNLNTKDEAAFAETLHELESWVGESSIKSTEAFATAEPKAESAKPITVSDGEIARLQKNAQLTEGQKGKSRRRASEKWDSGPTDNGLGAYASLGVLAIAFAALIYFGLQRIRQAAPERASALARASLHENVISKGRVRSLVSPETAAIANSQKDSDVFSKFEVKPVMDTAGEPPLVSTPPLAPPVVNPNAFGSKPDGRLNNAATRGTLAPAAASESKSMAQVANQEPLDANSFERPIASSVEREPLAIETLSTDDSPKTAGNKTETKPDEKNEDQQEDPTDPFDGFPKSVDLPSVESTNEVVLATLNRNSIHLLGMELKSAEGVGKGRTSFALERNEATKRQWTLLEKKAPRNKGDSIGQFDFDIATGQIKFRWLPSAASSRIANFVRNCVVKMKLGSSTRTLALRSPVRLTDLKLTRNKPFAKLESALEWLPEPELLTFELLPFRESGLPRSWLEPAIAQPGNAMVAHFHEAASNRFMWLQIDTSIRKKVNLDLKLMLKHADGTMQPISKSKDLPKLATLLRKAAANAQREYDANKDLVAPKGKITKFKEFVAKLKSTAKKTLRQAEIAEENIAIVESYYNREIPMRVTFQTDDYQIVLIESSP